MKELNRTDIHIISRTSNWPEEGISHALKTHVYSGRAAWQKFLRIFLLTLGVGFTVAGIVFFFAYNWAYLHRFVKIGLVEGLLLTAVAVALLPKLKGLTGNIVLTGAAILVGVLFAVFGQVYQTGANAYDFFLAWTLFIFLWTVVSNFAPLWLLLLLLVNITISLYAAQVANKWSGVLVTTILFAINVAALVVSLSVPIFRSGVKAPLWFSNVLALAAAAAATIGISGGIFQPYEPALGVLILITAIAYAAGIWYGLQMKSGFYLSIIPFSGIVIFSALFIKLSEGELMYLWVSVFVAASITGVIKNLMTLQKKWANEN